jgi:Ni,Fe-hydrogenase maturation factor
MHDMDMATAVEMGKMLGMPLPTRIHIWGIEACDVETFSEEVTEDVARAIPRVLAEVMDELGRLDSFVTQCKVIVKDGYCGSAPDKERG